jgi:integrase
VSTGERELVAAAGEPAAPPAGLLEKLAAVIRPEFRGDDLVLDPRDPVFGGPPCAVPACARPVRNRGMCWAHRNRWHEWGEPDTAAFARAASPVRGIHGPLACGAAGCRFGRRSHGLCARHARQWKRAGQPELAAWQISQEPFPPPVPPPSGCLASGCDLWTDTASPYCISHDTRWRARGRPGAGQPAISSPEPVPGGAEHIDLRRLPRTLRLEMQYVLQSRRDEAKQRLVPYKVQRYVNALAATGITCLMDQPENFWKQFAPPAPGAISGCGTFLRDARHRLEELAWGRGWDIEYPREVWRLRNLGLCDAHNSTICFTQIPQPWLRDLVKRWARWRFSTGLGAHYVAEGVRALARFADFLATHGADGIAGIDRALLERYLADLRAELGGRPSHGDHTGALTAFFTAIRQHHWDDALPASAMIFPEDYPARGELPPRALAAHVMTQVEDPANLARWDNPAYRLITLILMHCGLRVSDAARLPSDCVVTDADGAPYLRYYNHKMKREALVPIDDELRREIAGQQQRALSRWPGGVPVLFPRPKQNIDGHHPIKSNTYREGIHRWLQACDIRDEHGNPVHLTPHQWRHTFATALINRDVPQHVVQKILDHDSPSMTAHYARLHDTTVRAHWERARKVNIQGETVAIDPGGPLAEAAWAKQRLSRATQALPNGYCALPLARTCPHANACLTCPMFITTAEFLPQHHAQHKQALQIISAAEANGQHRLAEMNQQVAASLQNIITALGTGTSTQQDTADAS